jgi:thioredoxin 1
MKKYIISVSAMLFIATTLSFCGNPAGKGAGTGNSSVVEPLTSAVFKEKIYNYEKNSDWKYEGKTPAIIDFYADWCPPCRQLSPLVEEIAKEYSGRITVYKVNTDKEKELSIKMGITNLPTLLFIPATGKPQYTLGALPKSTLIKAVNEILLVK